ncbi:phosphatase PAP2 family protein [Mesoplasma lactucae]|uniref:phosphatase PAP2 family protein n=1 Tax=Mesoplasma lactucae TaxID=138853 RepID=UPI001473B9FF|nr:phosphatase PAP2 family protein [Mesoplasma lactucae]
MKTKKKVFNNWEAVVAISVVALFVLFGVVNLIVTGWYQNDVKLSQVFNKGMKYDFIRGWTAFVIQDGYEGVVTFIFPMIFVILEALFLYMRKVRPHGWFAHHASNAWPYMTLASLWTVGIVIEDIFIFLGDTGFGWGYNVEFQTGWRFMIPAFCVSLVIQLTYLWLATYFVHYRLAKRDDFLEAEYWKRACVALIFIGYIYIPVLVFKPGFGRQYYYNITWGDILKRIQTEDPDRFNHYMNQTKYNYGFNPTDAKLEGNSLMNGFDYGFWNGETSKNKFIFNAPMDANFAWWKPYGWFAFGKPSLPASSLAVEKAFPSGHMGAAFGMVATCYIFANKGSRQKAYRIGKRIGFVIGVLYCLEMMFALQVSLSHWWSDIAWTCFWLGPAWYFSWLTVHAVVRDLFPKWNHYFVSTEKWHSPDGKRELEKRKETILASYYGETKKRK